MDTPPDPNVPYTQYSFYDYYRNAQGEMVYLKGVNKPVTPNTPHEVDMSTFVPDAVDPGNAPFIFPGRITYADALAAQQAASTTVDGRVTSEIKNLALSALRADGTQMVKLLQPVIPSVVTSPSPAPVISSIVATPSTISTIPMLVERFEGKPEERFPWTVALFLLIVLAVCGV